MIAFFKKLARDRRGNVILLMAAALPLLMGAAGLASDTIEWVLWKRQLQRAADSAAIAGVYARFQGQAVEGNTGAVRVDLNKNNRTNIALLNGYPQITYPTNAQWSNPVRVRLALQKRLGFSSLFLSSPPTIVAEATAAGIETGEYCVVSLENTNVTGISIGGNATVDLGCGMITNSTSLDAAVAFGSSDVDASPIAAVGGIDASDNWADDVQLLPWTLAQEDPFKDVYPPTTFPNGQCPSFPNGNQDFSTTHAAGSVVCFRDMTIQNNVVLGPATYVIDGGSVDIKAQAHVTCNGCTIVLTSRDAATNPGSIGNVTINGGAEVDLVAPSTGPYKGLIMYQDRRAVTGTSANRTNHINGNASSSFQGAFYFPSQETLFNGTAGMSTQCVQLVARRVSFSGNASISNNCPPNSGADSFVGRHVRLVG